MIIKQGENVLKLRMHSFHWIQLNHTNITICFFDFTEKTLSTFSQFSGQLMTVWLSDWDWLSGTFSRVAFATKNRQGNRIFISKKGKLYAV